MENKKAIYITGWIILIIIVSVIFFGNSTATPGKSVSTVQTIPSEPERNLPPPPTMYQENQSCKSTAEIENNRKLISSCYVVNQLTSQCELIFDSNGNYTNNSQEDSVDKLQSYLTEVNACLSTCYLSPSIESEVKEEFEEQEKICDQDFPTTSGLQENR